MYLNKSIRRNGRVTSVYLGSGEAAVLIAEGEALDRAKRRAERAERARIEAADAPVIAWCKAVENLAREVLVATGHYNHHRGSWRRRGTMGTKTKQDEGATTAPDRDRTLDLLERARDGDVSTRFEVRELLQGEMGERVAQYEMSAMMVMTLVHGASPKSVLQQEILAREIERTAAELAGPDPSPLERLLAHRVAVCRFVLDQAEFSRASSLAEGASLPTLEFQQERVDSAQRRFLQAVKMLATVRRLALPGPRVAVNVSQTVKIKARRPKASRGLSVPELMNAAPRG